MSRSPQNVNKDADAKQGKPVPADAARSGKGLEGSEAEAFIALGSNIGDREGLLSQALSLLDEHPDIRIARISGLYETAPVGYADQPSFLNMAAAIRTSLAPLPLLRVMQGIENRLGRTRDIRFGPRTIDLDLLLMDEVEMSEDDVLILPHPRMMERAFVLVPLNDVLEDGHPLKRVAASLALRALEDGGEGITLWNTINWHSASAHSES